jgi:hypothetical protein
MSPQFRLLTSAATTKSARHRGLCCVRYLADITLGCIQSETPHALIAESGVAMRSLSAPLGMHAKTAGAPSGE